MVLKRGTITLRAIEEEDMEFCRLMINSEYIESNSIGRHLKKKKKGQLEWFENSNSSNVIRFMIDNASGPIGMIIASDIDWINRNCEVAIKLGEMTRLEKNDTQVAADLFLEYIILIRLWSYLNGLQLVIVVLLYFMLESPMMDIKVNLKLLVLWEVFLMGYLVLLLKK